MQVSPVGEAGSVGAGLGEGRREIDTRWVELKLGSNFSPRSYFAACIQAGTIFVHGGFSAQTGLLREFFACSLYEQPSTWRRLQGGAKAVAPPALRNHTLTPYLSNLLLVGGQRNVVENNEELYRYDLLAGRWSVVRCGDAKGHRLPALDSHAAILHKNALYLLNGFDSLSSDYFPHIAKLTLDALSSDTATFELIRAEGPRPSPRGNASCCLFEGTGTVFLFGGGCVQDCYGDLWSWQIESNCWRELAKTEDTIAWPDRRKGGTLVAHECSGTLFLFGGIKKVTKEQNDVMVYMIGKRRWIRIHSSTNDLYDPSPTQKQLAESPTLQEEKRRLRDRAKAHTHANAFRIESPQRMHDTANEFNRRPTDSPARPSDSPVRPSESPGRHNATEGTGQDFRRKISVVQEKKYREFMNRKKKLLGNIESGAVLLPASKRRSHSPTSEALAFSLACMGEQPKNDREALQLPKVIFDAAKGHVIGKKPCARDGHAALLHEDCMIILGGDRHMVAFSDAYMFRLDKGVQSLPHYQ